MMKTMIATCGRCGTKNRIPEKKQHHGPRCGRCGEVIEMAGLAVPVELGDHDLQAFLAESRLPVMVDFYSPDCGPCRSLAPLLDVLVRRYFHKVVVAKIDTRLHPSSASRYGIRGVPTLLFFRGGNLVDQLVGVPPESQLIGKLNNLAARV
jgi:thioredoxin 2